MVSVLQPNATEASPSTNRSLARQSSYWQQIEPIVTKIDDKMLQLTRSTKEHATEPHTIQPNAVEGVQPSDSANNKDDTITQLRNEAAIRQAENLSLHEMAETNKVTIAGLQSRIKNERDNREIQDKLVHAVMAEKDKDLVAFQVRLQAEIQEHTEDTKSLEAVIADKDKIVAELEARLESEKEKHQAAIQHLNAIVNDKDEAIAGLKSSAKDDSAALANLRELLKSETESILEFKTRVLAQVEGYRARVQNLEAAMQAKREAMLGLKRRAAAELGDREANIQELKEVLEKCQFAYAEMERLSHNERAGFETRIADLNIVLRERDEQVFELQKKLGNKQNKMMGRSEKCLQDEQTGRNLDFETFRRLIAENYAKTTALEGHARTEQSESEQDGVSIDKLAREKLTLPAKSNSGAQTKKNGLDTAAAATINKLEQDLNTKSVLINNLDKIILHLEDITSNKEDAIAQLAADIETKDAQLDGAIKTNVTLSAALAAKDVTIKQLTEALCASKDDKAKLLQDNLDRATDKKVAKKQRESALRRAREAQEVLATTGPLVHHNTVSGDMTSENKSAQAVATVTTPAPEHTLLPVDHDAAHKRQDIMERLRPVVVAGATAVPTHKVWPPPLPPMAKAPVSNTNWLAAPSAVIRAPAAPRVKQDNASAQPNSASERAVGSRWGPPSGMIWKARVE